jgi:hypothetical protein
VLGTFWEHFTCVALEVAVFVDGRIEDTVNVPELPGNGDNIAEHVLEDGLGGQHGVPQVVEGARAVAAVCVAEECQRVHQNLHFRNLKHVEFVCDKSSKIKQQDGECARAGGLRVSWLIRSSREAQKSRFGRTSEGC